MSDTKEATEEQSNEPHFSIEKIYLKDVSFESPAAPAVFTDEWNPEINMDLNSHGQSIDKNVYEVELSLTVTAKNKDKTAFLVEIKQCGIFSIANMDEENLNGMLGSFCPNILFPYANVTEIPSNPTLDTLSQYLNNNPQAIIEIGGYCDSRGSASGNYILGLKRANVATNYLLSKGVDEKQLIVISYGEENPISKNKNPNGTWNAEGQKYNRRVEFRMIEQGETSLLIWGAIIPEEFKNLNYKINYEKNENNNIESKY